MTNTPLPALLAEVDALMEKMTPHLGPEPLEQVGCTVRTRLGQIEIALFPRKDDARAFCALVNAYPRLREELDTLTRELRMERRSVDQMRATLERRTAALEALIADHVSIFGADCAVVQKARAALVEP